MEKKHKHPSESTVIGTAQPHSSMKRWLPPALQPKDQSPSDIKDAAALDGVSGFVGYLVQQHVVTKKLVDDALAYKKSVNGKDKRHLFQIFIEEFNVDRELVYEKFISYYSFKTLDLASFEMAGERLAFINKTLQGIPAKIRELAMTNKVLPFQIADNDTSKLQFVTPD